MIIQAEFRIDRFKLGHIPKPEQYIKDCERKCLCDLGAEIGKHIPFNKFTTAPGQEKYSLNVVITTEEKLFKIMQEMKSTCFMNMNEFQSGELRRLFDELKN